MSRGWEAARGTKDVVARGSDDGGPLPEPLLSEGSDEPSLRRKKGDLDRESPRVAKGPGGVVTEREAREGLKGSGRDSEGERVEDGQKTPSLVIPGKVSKPLRLRTFTYV